MSDIFQIDELLGRILSFISDGSTYKTVRLVARRWKDLSGDRVDSFSNHLWTLILKYPDAVWNWNYICQYTKLTLERIEKIPSEEINIAI